MRGLPKIAIARLKGAPEAPQASRASVAPAGLQDVGHPDANLLAAYVEKSLTEKERAQVLSHLSQCANCREVAALTLPPQDAPAESATVAPARHWYPWLVLRWGAMAAVLGAAALVVVLHPGVWRGSREIMKETPPPASVGSNASLPRAISPGAPSPTPPETADAKMRSKAVEASGAMAELKKALPPAAGLRKNEQLAPAKTSQQGTFMAAAQTPVTVEGENAPAAGPGRDQYKQENDLSARVPAPPPPAAPAAVPAEVSEDAVKSKGESQTGQTIAHSITRSVEVVGTGGGGGYGPAPAPAPRIAPPPSTQTRVPLGAPAPMGAMRASRKDAEFGAGHTPALWNIAPSGEVQCSLDGGRSFQQIHVAEGVKFLAVAALGNEVWAGGDGGALFHSANGGATWTRAGVSPEGSAVTETITGIQIHNPQHLTITTTSGSQWVSQDGGQHWQKHL